MTKTDLVNFEKQVATAFEQGLIKAPVHLSGGNEDQLIEIFKSIKPTDWVFSTHRNHYHYLLHTGDEDGLWKELLGQADGCCGGMSRSMHTCNRNARFISSGIVAGCVGIAVGVAFGIKKKSSSEKVWCFIGDGACDSGWFHEAYRFVRGHNLPLTFIVEDNNRSVCTTTKDRWGTNDCMMEQISTLLNIVYYHYIPTYPHVGIGRHCEW